MNESLYEIEEGIHTTEEKKQTENKQEETPLEQNKYTVSLKSTIGILVSSVTALLVAFIALFSSKVSQMRQNKAQDDSKSLIDDTKSLLAVHRTKINKDRLAINHLDETIRSLAKELKKFANDPVRTRKLKAEAQALLMTKRLKESVLNHSITDVYSLEQTMAQVEQFSMSIERHNQMRPLLKNLTKLIPSKSAMENLANQKKEFMESTRKMNERMTDINFQIIESGEEYQEEQSDTKDQVNFSISNELDEYLKVLDEEEASQIVIDMPSVPLNKNTDELSQPLISNMDARPLVHHNVVHKPLVSEFKNME